MFCHEGGTATLLLVWGPVMSDFLGLLFSRSWLWVVLETWDLWGCGHGLPGACLKVGELKVHRMRPGFCLNISEAVIGMFVIPSWHFNLTVSHRFSSASVGDYLTRLCYKNFFPGTFVRRVQSSLPCGNGVTWQKSQCETIVETFTCAMWSLLSGAQKAMGRQAGIHVFASFLEVTVSSL